MTRAYFRERPPPGRFSFTLSLILLLLFFNKLCLVAKEGRKVNNGVTILLIDARSKKLEKTRL